MKRREVDLNEAEQQWLYRFTQSGRKNHQEFKRAQILLASEERIGMKDAQIAKALGVSEATVYNTRRRYLEEGACATVLEGV